MPSITPLHGNNPAFLVAQVAPLTSTIVDYSVYAANNNTGIGAEWDKEYRYSEAYRLPDFSSASVERLVAGFAQDKSGANALSRNYVRWYSAGDSNGRDATLQRTWRAYVCSLARMMKLHSANALAPTKLEPRRRTDIGNVGSEHCRSECVMKCLAKSASRNAIVSRYRLTPTNRSVTRSGRFVGERESRAFFTIDSGWWQVWPKVIRRTSGPAGRSPARTSNLTHTTLDSSLAVRATRQRRLLL